MSPTHIIYDTSEPSTPASTLPSRGSSVSARVSSLRETPSLIARLPLALDSKEATAVDASVTISSANSPPLSPTSPTIRSQYGVPSLSQSYPQELDYEHGLELLSAPSSRPDTPFSSMSQALSANDTSQHHSLYYSLSPNASSPPRAPSRSLSDLDLLSDLGESQHGGMSPRSSIDDEVLSEISDSSWVSGSARSRQ